MKFNNIIIETNRKLKVCNLVTTAPSQFNNKSFVYGL